MFRSNYTTIVIYNFILTTSTVLFGTSAWYLLGLFPQVDQATYYSVQLILFSLGGIWGSWISAALISTKGIRYALIAGALMSSMSYSLCMLAIYIKNLPCFLLGCFISGMFASTDSVLNTEALFISNDVNLSKTVHYRELLYGVADIIVASTMEVLLDLSGDAIVLSALPAALLFSLLGVAWSWSYEDIALGELKTWSWSLPVRLQSLKPFIPILLYNIAAAATETLLPLIISKVVSAEKITLLLSRVNLVTQLSLLGYSLVFAGYQDKHTTAKIRSVLSFMLMGLLFLFDLSPVLIYFFGLSGITSASMECDVIELIGRQYTVEEVPYMCSMLFICEGLANLLSVFLLYILPFKAYIYAVALIYAYIIMDTLCADYRNKPSLVP